MGHVLPHLFSPSGTPSAPRAGGWDVAWLLRAAGDRLMGALSHPARPSALPVAPAAPTARDPAYDARASDLWRALCQRVNATLKPGYADLAALAAGGPAGRARLAEHMLAFDERIFKERMDGGVRSSSHAAAVGARDAWGRAQSHWDRVVDACHRGDLETAFIQEMSRVEALLDARKSLEKYRRRTTVILGDGGFVAREKLRAYDPARLPAPVVKFLEAFPGLFADPRDRADMARALALESHVMALDALLPALERACYRQLSAACPDERLRHAWDVLTPVLSQRRSKLADSFNYADFSSPDALDRFALEVGSHVRWERDQISCVARDHASRTNPSGLPLAS